MRPHLDGPGAREHLLQAVEHLAHEVVRSLPHEVLGRGGGEGVGGAQVPSTTPDGPGPVTSRTLEGVGSLPWAPLEDPTVGRDKTLCQDRLLPSGHLLQDSGRQDLESRPCAPGGSRGSPGGASRSAGGPRSG